jgi:hypothetical protein
MYYTEFYFRSDAISIEDRANFHLCCNVKYDIHCTQFHETALCGDLLYRIPLQLVKKNGSYWYICIHATKYNCHCSNFHKAHAYLTTFAKTPPLNLIGHGQLYGHLKLRWSSLFCKECPTLEKKDIEYHHHNDSNRIINATFCSQSS